MCGRSKSACLESNVFRRLSAQASVVAVSFFVSQNGWGTTAQLSHGWSKSAGNLAKWTPRARRCWRAALSWNPTAKRASKSVLRRAVWRVPWCPPHACGPRSINVYQDCYIFFLLWHRTQRFDGLLIIVRELVYPYVFRCKKDICLVEFDLFGCCYSSCVTKFDCTGAKHGKALLVGLHSRDGGASKPSKEPSHQSTNDSAAICSLFRLFRAFILLSFRFHFAFICTYIYTQYIQLSLADTACNHSPIALV